MPHLKFGNAYRYARDKDSTTPEIDGAENFRHLTHTPGQPAVQLERGINAPAVVHAPDGQRRSVILLRSSPWKAGTTQAPWHDVFDLDNGHVRYFGDHKVDTALPLGQTGGNKVLLEQFGLHASLSPSARAQAAPLLLFRSITRNGSPKGHVEFCGLGVVERAERVVQRDRQDRTFVNYVFDIAILDLRPEEELVSWQWIKARRDPTASNGDTLDRAPESWKRWIRDGNHALPQLRRRVATSRVRTLKDQRPVPGSAQQNDLTAIYTYFHGRKHDFEHLAAAVAARIVRSQGTAYVDGWLTRASGDGGADFVGRIDAGLGTAVTKLVVLGQAKCIVPGQTSISAEQVSRVAARLKRGWMGIFVTTDAYSPAAQLEIIEDQHPIILVSGLVVAEQVRSIAETTHAGNIERCTKDLVAKSPYPVVQRRPEEILLW